VLEYITTTTIHSVHFLTILLLILLISSFLWEKEKEKDG